MEYRIEQLARTAGVAVDTIRFYQGKGLLDSVGLRAPTAADPWPEEMPTVPDRRDSLTAIAGSA